MQCTNTRKGWRMESAPQRKLRIDRDWLQALFGETSPRKNAEILAAALARAWQRGGYPTTPSRQCLRETPFHLLQVNLSKIPILTTLPLQIGSRDARFSRTYHEAHKAALDSQESCRNVTRPM